MSCRYKREKIVKTETLIIYVLVHQRDVTRMLVANKVNNPKNFDWLCQMRFYFDPKNSDVLQQLSIHMAILKKITKIHEE
jgi:hypothetical protein